MNAIELTRKGYDYFHRRVELFLNPNFSIDEKFSLCFSKNLMMGAKQVFLGRMSTTARNEKYFNVGGYNIFFQPPYKVVNEDSLLNGIAQVLDECFLFPYYVSKEVSIRPGDVVFDLGANIGAMAMEFAKSAGPKGKVYAFEPVVHQTLEKNIKENGIKNITVVPKAVAEKNYSTEISVSDFCLDSTFINNDRIKNTFNEKLNVDVISLDEFVSQNNIPRVDFIKIDIEGFEELAIKGAHNLIVKHRPKWSIASYHTDFENEKQHPKLVKLLQKYDYTIKECGSRHIYAW